MGLWLVLGLAGISVAGLGLAWRPLRRLGREIQVERARELFSLQRERLEARFLSAAGSTGRPRGLRWKAVEWTPGEEFGRERKTGRLAALVGVTIQFEAIEGGDMEGVAAVSNLRNASAVFFYHQRQWHTTGMTIYNLNPDEALRHFKNQYEPVPVRRS